METDSCNKAKKGGISMNGDNHETAIELANKIKFVADELGRAEHSPKEVRRQICQLTQRLIKVLECVKERIG